MYAPVPDVRPRIPYLTCLAASSVWYLALIAGYSAVVVKSGGSWQFLLHALATGLIPWLLSSLIVWLIMRTTGVQPWLLIVITLPFFLVLWVMLAYFITIVMVMIFALNGG